MVRPGRPCTCLNAAVTSGPATPGTRDLHLELRGALIPGARGSRDRLLTALRAAVRSGRLTPGTALPPSRVLAADLGVARNTVAEAYAELVAEGLLGARQGAGTWVLGGATPLPARPRGTPGTPVHDLMPGAGDVAQFPRAAWLAATRRALTDAPNDALRLGDPRGRIELRAALADYLTRARGVRCSPDSIVVTAGTRHSVETLGRTLGGPVAVEAYGLFLFREALAALDVPTIPIGIDDHGAVVADLDRHPTLTAALLTPAHHFPHGVPLHPARRTAALEWATRTGTYVLEDDYDGEFRYDRQPVGALQGLDPDRVVYLGSASKALAPALRLGWMVLPDALLDGALAALGGQQFHVNGIAALTMAEFVSNGSYDKHIRKMRLAYRRRRDRLVTALAPLPVEIVGLSAGLHLLLRLPEGTEAEALRRAGEAGVAVSGLALLRHPDADGPAADGVVVNFGTPTEGAFDRAVAALCRVLSSLGGR